MAYNVQQRQYIAREIARAGGNVSSATRALQTEYESMRGISERTLRRFCGETGSQELIAVETNLLQSVQIEAARESERARIKREMLGSYDSRISEMEAKGWEMFERLGKLAETEFASDPKTLLAFWQTAQKHAMELRRLSGQGIHELWQAECLIRAFKEVLQSESGPALAERVLKLAWGRYQEYVAAHQEQTAKEATDGQAQAAADPTASAR